MGESGEQAALSPDVRFSDLSEDWRVVHRTGEADSLEAELERELCPHHVLHGTEVEAVAVRRLGKETVWWLPLDRKWAVVHLTRVVETDPRWPSTEILDSWASVIAELADRDRS